MLKVNIDMDSADNITGANLRENYRLLLNLEMEHKEDILTAFEIVMEYYGVTVADVDC